MQSRDVDKALANAAALLYAAEADDEEAEEVFLQGGELTNRCRNPFCSKVLANCYAHYCENRWVCQQYRVLELQCLANAERAAVQDVESLGRTDSFMNVQAREQPRSMTRTATENRVADEPYVIPRRKRPGATRTGAAEVHKNTSRSSEPYRPWRATTRRCGSTDGELRMRKRLRLGRGMRFTDVLAHFEPRATNIPVSAPSLQTGGDGIQEEEAETQRAPVPHPSLRVAEEPRFHAAERRNERSLAEGGRYVHLRPSSNYLSRIGRPAYNPHQCDTESAVPQAGNNHRADASPVAPLVLPSRTMMEQLPRRNASPTARSIEAVIPDSSYEDNAWNTKSPHEWRLSSPQHPQLRQEDRRGEYRSRSAPEPHYYLPPACSTQHSVHRSDARFGHREEYGREPVVEPSRFFSVDHESCRVYRPQYDGAGNRLASEENYNRDLDTQLAAQQATRQEEGWRSDTRSLRSSRCANEPNGNDVRLRYVEPFLSEQHPKVTTIRVNASDPDAVQTVSVDMDDDHEASFSFHDPFIVEVLSQFIRHLPTLLEPVMNVTKKPRKMQWYIDYMKKIERTCNHLRVQMKDKRVLVTILNRVWIDLKGSSTIVVLRETIQRLRAEAISWNNLKSEVEQSLEIYKNRQGDTVDLSNVFTRAWNNLKSRAGDEWQSNYFRGARLHHWNFVVGKVEIGSGSHEEKREAFRLAAISAAEFLLRLDDGQNDRRWRPSCDESDSSEDVEFMFVRSAGSGPIAADAIITISDSSSSTSEDVIQTDPPSPATLTPQIDEEDNDVEVVEMASRHHSVAAALVSEPDTNAEAFSGVEPTRTVWSSNYGPAGVVPSDEESPPDMAVTAIRPCRLCEIIRMRKPDSAGCRQCQMTNPSRNVNTHEL